MEIEVTFNPSWIPFKMGAQDELSHRTEGGFGWSKWCWAFYLEGSCGRLWWGGTKELHFGGLLNPPPWHQRVGLEPGESKRNLTNDSFLCVGWIIEFVGYPHQFLLFSHPSPSLSDQHFGQGAQFELIWQRRVRWEPKPNQASLAVWARLYTRAFGLGRGWDFLSYPRWNMCWKVGTNHVLLFRPIRVPTLKAETMEAE